VIGQDEMEMVAHRDDVLDGYLAVPAHGEDQHGDGRNDDEPPEALACNQRRTRLGGTRTMSPTNRGGLHGSLASPSRELVLHRGGVRRCVQGCDGLGLDGK